MRPTAGRWVSGDDFFDREGELRVLESHVRDRNHLLLTGQRRMGKTSIARELGRRLEGEGWICLFADVEGSTCAEDAVRFPSRLLRDWWAARFRNHHVPLESRCPDLTSTS